MTEGPYKLPEGWRWVRLGEVCEVLMGQSPPSSTYNHDSIGLPFFQGKADFGELHPTPRVWCTKPMKIAEAGDILISVRAPVGPTNLAKERCCIGRGLAALRAGHKVQTDWVLFYLRSIEQELGQSGSGSTFNAITKKELSAIPIPLPPLDAQRRIVARIEALMSRMREAKRLRQQAEEDAERLWQSVLAETFPRPGSDLPEGWRWVRLGEVARREAVLLRPSDYPSQRFRYLGMEHVAAGQWEAPEGVEVNGQEIKSQVVAFKPGLVLYGKLRPYLNKVVVPCYEGVASTEFVPIAPDPGVLDAEYLGAFLRTPSFVSYAVRNTTGSRQPRTRLEALWSALVPLPPLAEQRRIVAELEAVQEKLRVLREAQAETDEELKRLERSILDKAFRGEL